jgi:uncharacterized protein YecT (DUF1311 family)
MRFKIVLSIVLFAGISTSSIAGSCDKVLAQDDLTECLGAEFAKADQALNKTYRKLSLKLDADSKDLLKKAQLAWISYRDNDCRFESLAVKGGQAENTTYISCQTEKTLIRTNELKKSGW